MRSRILAALAYAGAAFVFGMGLGERGELGLVQHVFTLVIPLATLILAIYAKRGRRHVVLTGAAILGGLLFGQHQFGTAWDECVARGEELRVALERHRTAAGLYPSRLEKLDGPLPCSAGLRKSIVHYMTNGESYRLWFANDREMWVATDRNPFTSSGKP